MNQLAKETNRSVWWVRKRLDNIKLQEQRIVPQPVVVIADTTFWGRHYGVCVFRVFELERNIWHAEVSSEKASTYYYGRKILEDKGWIFKVAVVDGRRGLASVFSDIPVQICQFHQMKRVTTYLTRKPQTIAGKELRQIMLCLPRSNEKEFTALLDEWHTKWKDFIELKTHVFASDKWHYTHKNIRGAYLSMRRNLPYLFTYQKYPELNIPNTTNSLDGMFTQLKAKLSIHRGLRRDRRYKVIAEILKGKAN